MRQAIGIIGAFCAIMLANRFLMAESAGYLLGDFESDAEVAQWQAPLPPPRSDVRFAPIERSSEQASHGRSSLKITFTPHEQGLAEYVILEPTIDNGGLSRTDWSGYDLLQADFFNPTDGPMRLQYRFRDFERQKQFRPAMQLEPGWNRLTWSIRAMERAGLDTTQIAEWSIFQTRPEQPVVLYLDRVRLVRNQADEFALLQQRIERLQMALAAPQTELHQGLEALSGELAENADNGGDRTARAERLLSIRQRLDGLAEQVRARLVQRTVDWGEALDTPAPVDGSVAPMTPGEEGADALLGLDAMRGLEQWQAAFTERLAEKRLEARLRALPSDRRVAIGQVAEPFPEQLPYQPRTFGGPLVSRVTLDLARGETGTRCLMLLPVQGDLRGVRLEATALQSTSHDTLAAERVRFAPLGYRRARPGAPALGLLLRPEIQQWDIPADAQHAVWLEVRVPQEAAPGNYRGEVRVHAATSEGGDAQVAATLALEVRVRAFAIPQVPSLPVVTHYNRRDGRWGQALDDLVMDRRVNAGSIYHYAALQSPERLRRRVEGGSRKVNLLRISEKGDVFRRDEQGNIVSLSEGRRALLLRRLAEGVPALREAGLLQHTYVYGFDEPTADLIPAMEEIFAQIKAEHGLETFFTTYLPIWEERPVIRHVDHYGVTWEWLTPQRIDAIRAQGSKVWAYNLSQSGIHGRTQFWAAFKNGLDGLLHYSLHSGSREPVARAFPIEEGAVGGLIPSVVGEEEPMATILFEQWRLGSQDYEYLRLLQGLLETHAAGHEASHPYLIQASRRWIGVPETIAGPAHQWRRSPSVADLEAARAELADLIEAWLTLVSRF